MHTYYKTKHLHTLVQLALNMLFSSSKKQVDSSISMITSAKSFVQLKSNDLTPDIFFLRSMSLWYRGTESGTHKYPKQDAHEYVGMILLGSEDTWSRAPADGDEGEHDENHTLILWLCKSGWWVILGITPPPHPPSCELQGHFPHSSLCLHLCLVSAAEIWNKTFQVTSLTPLTNPRRIDLTAILFRTGYAWVSWMLPVFGS